MSTIRVLLADDHAIVRDGLKTLIEKEAGMEVIAEAENGHKAVQLAQELQPDVVIMDVTMPDMNGIEATREIMEQTPGVRVIGSLDAFRPAVRPGACSRQGSCGYLLKDCAFEELATAIRNVAGGNTYLSPMISSWWSRAFSTRRPGFLTDRAPLSRRASARSSGFWPRGWQPGRSPRILT